ncbi:hypothetical protein BD413DRAFT_205127 [Trametes elegans]|nr:hypothetical protein BD413DRAFT_205127 [Trametes elegans]
MSSASHGLVAGGPESAPITQSAFERRDTASHFLFQPQTATPIPKSSPAVRRQQRYASHIPRPQSIVNPLSGKRHDHHVASESGLSSEPATRAFVRTSPRDPGSTSRSPTPASFPWTQSIVLPSSLSPSAIPTPHNDSAKSGRRGTGSTRAHPAEPSLASDAGSSVSLSSRPLDRAKRGHSLESVTADEEFRHFVDALPYISLAEPAATSRGSPSPDMPMPQTVAARTSTSEAAPPLSEQSAAGVTTDMPVAQWQGKLNRMPNGTTIWQAAYVFVPKQRNAPPTPEDTKPAQTPPRPRSSRDTQQAHPAAHSSPPRPSSASPDPADIIHTLQQQLLRERAQSKAEIDGLRASAALAEQLQRERHELAARCAAAEGKLSTVRAQLELLSQTLQV